jgi:hypothetical protein
VSELEMRYRAALVRVVAEYDVAEAWGTAAGQAAALRKVRLVRRRLGQLTGNPEGWR